MEIAARRLVRFSRGVKKLTIYEKMPKIDTLDALDDEMTSILNTL